MLTREQLLDVRLAEVGEMRRQTGVAVVENGQLVAAGDEHLQQIGVPRDSCAPSPWIISSGVPSAAPRVSYAIVISVPVLLTVPWGMASGYETSAGMSAATVGVRM